MIKFRCLLVFVFAALNNQQGLACFILFLSDGQRVLVGNHEDWFAKDAAIRIHSRMPGKYGAITFTFLSEGWPQGGMNERGLFFDAARTPLQEIEFSSDQKQYAGYIWQAVLDKCATVGEALNFLSQYQLPDLAESHVMLADSAGNAVVVGIDRGKVSVKRFKRNYLMQSNFSPWNPEACWRFEKAQQHLSIYPASSLDNMRNILEQTHQDSMTVYSNIYDLRNKTIYTYNKRNFSNPIVTSLPDLFRYGNCIQSLDAVNATDWNWNKCLTERPAFYRLTGKIIDRNNGHPLSYVNVGLFEQNIGTLSDPDGSFELEVPSKLYNDSVIFSSMGFDRMKVAVSEMKDTASVIKLNSSSIILKEVTVSAKRKLNKRSRLGWMGGDDGALPFDTIQGGGAIAILVESPTVPVFVEKLQVRLMYNSKDTLKLRFHLYAYDSVRQLPGRELLSKEIILKENKRFGWLRYDLSSHDITLKEKYFFLGFEWIDDRQTRRSMLEGLRNWETWKKDQYTTGNKKVERMVSTENGIERVRYKYHGNMMNWPGFNKLPPFTGLMVENGKHEKTKNFKTFERKTSFGQWYETDSTLNAVITVAH